MGGLGKVVFGAVVGAGAVPFALAVDSFTFVALELSHDIYGQETVVATAPPVTSGGAERVFEAATTLTSDPNPDGHVWYGDQNGFALDTAKPTTGGGDATIFNSTDGHLYYVDIATGYTIRVLSRTYDGPWGTPVTIGTSLDRPWFASYGTTTYLVANHLSSPHHPDAIYGYKIVPGGTWSFVSAIPAPADHWANLPQVLPGGTSGTIVLVLSDVADTPWKLKYTESTDGGEHWWSSPVDIDGTVSAKEHPMSAMDAAGDYYVSWRDGSQRLLFKALTPSGWNNAMEIVHANDYYQIFGGGIVGGSTGNLDVAWYSEADADSYWNVQFFQITGANTNNPTVPGMCILCQHAVQVVTAGSPGSPAFGDFMFAGRTTAGGALIGFSCISRMGHELATCKTDNSPHPWIAIQSGGPTL